MSLVLYDYESNKSNPNLSIILNDPLRNALVLHNKQTNEFSVLKTVGNVKGNWNGDGNVSGDQLLREQLVPFELVKPDGSNNGMDLELSRFRDNNAGSAEREKCPNCGYVMNHEARGGRRDNSEDDHINEPSERMGRSGNVTIESGEDGFIDLNYFRLLGNTPFHESHGGVNLSDNLFTQGYFEKFFKEIEILGRGARGSVFKVEHILNDISLGYFALKKITIGDDSKWLVKVLKEVTMLCKISFNNQNLVNYNHVWLEVSSINEFGPPVPCAYILQQYCSGGNLEDFVLNLIHPVLKPKEYKRWKLKHKGRVELKGRFLSNDEILVIFHQIVLGVDELHKNHIIHRDLKPSNCLLSKPYISDFTNLQEDIDAIPTILVSDFGESQLEGEQRNATGSTGTLEYTAPELLLPKEHQSIGEIPQFSKKTDVYSLGMILYFLCFGQLPYKAKDFDLLRAEIKGSEDGETHHFDTKNLVREDIRPEILELIKNMTSRDPEQRWSTGDVLKVLNNMGSIHIHNQDEEELKETEIVEKNARKRQLSLTDGKTEIKMVEYIYNHRKKLILLAVDLLVLNIARDYPTLVKLSIFLIGFSLNDNVKLRHCFYLTLIITFISLIMTTYNRYITTTIH